MREPIVNKPEKHIVIISIMEAPVSAREIKKIRGSSAFLKVSGKVSQNKA